MRLCPSRRPRPGGRFDEPGAPLIPSAPKAAMSEDDRRSWDMFGRVVTFALVLVGSVILIAIMAAGLSAF